GAPAGVRVTRDGADVDASSLGVALPVDPGDHVITTQAPGGPLITERVTLARGEAKTLTLQVAATAPAQQSKGEPATPLAPSPPDKAHSQRIVGYVIGGTGILWLAVGGIAGGIALGKASTRDDNCDKALKRCTSEGLAAQHDGLVAGN